MTSVPGTRSAVVKERVLDESGTRSSKAERKWNANGTQMERKWNANGTRMERE
jgi:hypothetical protein